jgi:hypothetical protein
MTVDYTESTKTQTPEDERMANQHTGHLKPWIGLNIKLRQDLWQWLDKQPEGKTAIIERLLDAERARQGAAKPGLGACHD